MVESKALSQWEIDALLNQIPASGAAPEEPGGQYASPEGERAFTRTIKAYDFRRPDKFSKEQWHTVQAMHETFARLAGSAFSSRLRTLVTVRLSSIDQGLYEEWQSQVPSQTVCYVLSMSPLSGSLLVEFNTDVASEVIDRMLGGNGLLIDRSRDMGDIELALLRSFSDGLATAVAEMWSTVTPVEPELQDLSLDASLVQVAAPNDVVLSAFFEVNLGSHLGAMSVCTPYALLEPVAQQLSAQVWRGTGTQRKASAAQRRRIAGLLRDAPLGISVELGSSVLPVRSLVGMREGDTMVLDTRADRPLALLVEGKRRVLCRPGMVGKTVSVLVTEVLQELPPDVDEEPDDGEPSAEPSEESDRDLDSPQGDRDPVPAAAEDGEDEEENAGE